MLVANVPSRPLPSVQDWTCIVRGEYAESPGLSLTAPQVQRLWSLDADTCDAVLQALIGGGFLRRTHNGLFVRVDGGH